MKKRFALFGAGRIGRIHARNLAASPNAQLRYVIDVNDPTKVTNLTGTTVDEIEPKWSPDGSRIAYTVDDNSGVTRIFVMNADGTGLTRITDAPPAEYRPRWSTEGIVFHANASGTPAIFFVNPDGTGLTQLTRGNSWSYDAAWKP